MATTQLTVAFGADKMDRLHKLKAKQGYEGMSDDLYAKQLLVERMQELELKFNLV
jgi:hypothetical protein